MKPSDEFPEKRCAITGAGQSEVGRRLGRDPLELTLDAVLAAIDDAGLTTEDIDGVSTYPGMLDQPPGFTGAGAYDVIDNLRLNVNWYDSGLETSGQLGSFVKACLAVGAGMADHVVCFRSVWEGSAQGGGGRSAVIPGATAAASGKMFRAGGFLQWNLPMAAPSASQWIAMFARAHMDRYGITEEQLAQIALNGRRNAQSNPDAIYREPMTLADYFASRVITTPFRLYDCDVPCDGATAVIVSRTDRAKDLRRVPLAVEAVGVALHDRPSWDQLNVLGEMCNRDAAAQMWGRTDLKPSDVQLAELYDGFSWLTMSWLEALGLCEKGGSGEFVAGGANIARDGRLPLNTHGGQLSAGRLHGYGFIHEAAVQMWGDAGARQVRRDPQVAVVANGGGNTCGCFLLTKGA